MRASEVIGEAVKMVSNDLRGICPELPWREIIGTRAQLPTETLGRICQWFGETAA
jgi:uncharacterized protein with HEPN domain